MPTLRPFIAWLTPLLISACARWPTWRLVDTGTDPAAEASTPPGEALWDQTDWMGPVDEAPNNELPTDATTLEAGTGWVRTGALQGWGWDPRATADKGPPPGCPAPSQFPPTPTGDYLGDLDWSGIAPVEAGTLCATVRFDLPSGLAAVRYDLLLYELDECRTPITVWRSDDLVTDADPVGVLGLTLGAPEDGWGVHVSGGGELGIVLAGVWPDDEDLGGTLTVPWTMAVSLVATGTDDQAGLCPTLPETL